MKPSPTVPTTPTACAPAGSQNWTNDPNEMAGVIDKATCVCGCYIDIHSSLEQAVKEAGTDRCVQ